MADYSDPIISYTRCRVSFKYSMFIVNNCIIKKWLA